MKKSPKMLTIRPGLKTSNVHAYDTAGHQRKQRFHRDGKLFLESLAKALGLSPGSYAITSNKGGMAVSGEVMLDADHLFVQLSEVLQPGISVLYRSRISRSDHMGGTNHWVSIEVLQDPAAQLRFIEVCRQLMQEGAQRAAQRKAA